MPTFAEAKTRIARGILRDDLAPSYGDFINEAVREAENRRDWLHMKSKAEPLTIPVSAEGRSTVALPANFKSLQKRQAVFYIADDGGYVPAEVVSEAAQIFRIWRFWGTPIITWPPRLFLDEEPTGSVIGMVEPNALEFNIRVDYYGYSPEMVADDDTNPLLTKYPKMIYAKAKAIAFSEINDQIAEGFEEEFEKKFGEAARAEAHAEVAGRELRL